MIAWGYTLLCEQAGPRQLVDDAVAAERAGFDFSVISDHYFPWLDRQGHSPNTWAVLGAVAQATDHIPLMTFVTCPTMRYHPAVVAQQAATVQLLSQHRFRLGLGAGENLNEHIVGRGWPSADVRHEMLAEAVQVIRSLFAGGYTTLAGGHFRVDSAKLWDLPDTPPPIGLAASGTRSATLAGELADLLISTDPVSGIIETFHRSGGAGKPAIGQLPVCYDPDRDAAVARVHDQFRWFAGGWKVNAELPGTAAFAAATSFVRPADVAAAIPCGDDVGEFTDKLRPFVDAGFDEVALVQAGGSSQQEFIGWAKRRLLPALRGL